MIRFPRAGQSRISLALIVLGAIMLAYVGFEYFTMYSGQRQLAQLIESIAAVNNARVHESGGFQSWSGNGFFRSGLFRHPLKLKKLPEVSPPGTRRLDVTCDHVTTALHAMHEMPGVRNATVFGQSMHLLVDDTVKRAQIDEQLRKVGITDAEIHDIGPSLEDVFVELSAKHAAEQRKAA